MIGTIYQIINRVNGMKYIGQTTIGTNKAWKEHIDNSKRMSQQPLHRAMREHGNHNFIIKEVCECSIEELDKKELEFIEEFNTYEGDNGYNIKPEVIEEPVIYVKPIVKEKVKEEEKKPVNKLGCMSKEFRCDGKHLSSKVMSVHVETGEERTWNSITEAALELTGTVKSTGNISNAMNKGYKAYGYLWKRLTRSSRNTHVYGINKVTWKVTPTYKSIRSAAAAFGSEHTKELRKSLNNPRKYSWKGHYWFKQKYDS